MSIVVDHVVFRVSDFEASRAFYEASLAELGFEVLGGDEHSVSFGREDEDDFAIGTVGSGPGRDRVTTGAHVAFIAPDVDSVKRWHAAAIDNGGTSNGEPGTRTEYSGNYYAAFAIDPDGNNVEAVFHSPVPVDH